MKKKYKFLLSLAALFIIIGSIGTIHFYRESEHLRVAKQTKSYTLSKNKNLEIVLPKGIYCQVRPSNDDKIHVESLSAPIIGNLDWSFEQNKDTDLLKVDFHENKTEKPTMFFSFANQESSIYISIPKNMGTVKASMNNNSMTITDINIASLDISGESGDIHLDAIKSNDILIDSEQLSISLNDAIVTNTVHLKNAHGDTQAYNVRASDITVSSESGDIHLEQLLGSLSIDNSYGDSYINECLGPLQSKNKDGDTTIYCNKLKDNLSISSTYGDISLEVPEDLKNTEIITKNKYGDTSLFNTEKKNYKQGEALRKLSIETHSGDINVYSSVPDSENELDWEDEDYDSV